LRTINDVRMFVCNVLQCEGYRRFAAADATAADDHAIDQAALVSTRPEEHGEPCGGNDSWN
jgi:hypothetical protein